MTTATSNVQILGLFKRKDNEQGIHIARAAFAFQTNVMQPIKIERSYPAKDKDKKPILDEKGKQVYKQADVGEVSGQITMTCRDVKVYKGKNGLFINIGGIVVPYDIRKDAEDLISAKLSEM